MGNNNQFSGLTDILLGNLRRGVDLATAKEAYDHFEGQVAKMLGIKTKKALTGTLKGNLIKILVATIFQSLLKKYPDVPYAKLLGIHARRQMRMTSRRVTRKNIKKLTDKT